MVSGKVYTLLAITLLLAVTTSLVIEQTDNNGLP